MILKIDFKTGLDPSPPLKLFYEPDSDDNLVLAFTYIKRLEIRKNILSKKKFDFFAEI